jgi:death-on-curing protein
MATSAWPGPRRVFCLLNGRDIVFDVDDAEVLVLAVATGESDAPDIALAIAERLR